MNSSLQSTQARARTKVDCIHTYCAIDLARGVWATPTHAHIQIHTKLVVIVVVVPHGHSLVTLEIISQCGQYCTSYRVNTHIHPRFAQVSALAMSTR